MKPKLAVVFAFFTVISQVAGQSIEIRSLDPFQSVGVGQSIKLLLVQGNENRIEISSEFIALERITTAINSSDHLSIAIENKKGKNQGYGGVTAKLYYSQPLNGITVSSSADLLGNEEIMCENMDIRVSSSGKANLSVTTNGLSVSVSSSGHLTLTGKADNLDISVTSAGKAALDITTSEVSTKVSSSGKLELIGIANDQVINCSSSGKVTAFGLKSKSVTANVSSSGRVEVTATESVIANVSSSAKVFYKGSPEKVIGNSSSGGLIKPAE